MIYGRLPSYDYSLLIRTDFSDNDAWDELCDSVQSPQYEGFRAMVEIIDDKAHSGLSLTEILLLLPKEPMRSFVFVADRRAIADADHPILVAAVLDEPTQTFRVTARDGWSVENNLRLANSDFAEFVDNVDSDGIFRTQE